MAATDGGRCIRNAPYRFSFQFMTQSGNQNNNAFDGSPTTKLSKDFAATTDGTPPTEKDADHVSALGYVDLSVGEMTFSYELQVEVDNITSSTAPFTTILKGEPCLDSGVAQSGAATSIRLRASASTVNDTYNGATIEIVRGAGAGQVRTITAYVGSTTTATVDRAWATTSPTSTSVYIIHPRIASSHPTVGIPGANIVSLLGETTALTVMTELYNGAIKDAVATTPDPSTTTFTGSAALSATADFYNRCFVVFTTGTLQGLMRPVSDYSTAKLFTFDATDAWPTEPTIGDEFVIISYRA